MKEILDIIHKTIYQFFDVCGDDEETPMSDKDKLLLEVNKAICNNLKALEQDPCEDCISRQAVMDIVDFYKTNPQHYSADALIDDIQKLPPVQPEQKAGHWIEKYAEDGCGELYSYWMCSECGRMVGYNLADIADVLKDYPYCHCGAKMVDPQERSKK